MIGREFLHTPGPTHIPDSVLNAMHHQAMDFADVRLKEMARTVFEDMRGVFRTQGHIFIYAGTGHAGWEAALANICVRGDTVLSVEIGHFSNSWAEHARALGINTEIIRGDWRRAVDPAEITAKLRADTAHTIKAVLVVQVDTATGIASDIPAVRAAIDAAGHPALLVVDVVASLAAMPFEFDAWGVDVAITAAQKALMCPPGMTLIAASQRAVDYAASLPTYQRYWDWAARGGPDSYLKFCGSMPEHQMFALRAALDLVKQQGLEAIFARHRRLARAVHSAVEVWAEAGALSFNAEVPAERSVTVTAVRTAEGVDAEGLRTYARENLGLSVAGGLGLLQGKAFRIGHMGSLNEPMILGCLATLDVALKRRGIPHGAHAVDAAIAALAEPA